MRENEFSRFLGGSPGSVILRLIVMSLIVGAAMVFFNVTPRDLLEAFRQFVWAGGIESLRTLLLYIAYGAVIVIPIFILVRLLKIGRRS